MLAISKGCHGELYLKNGAELETDEGQVGVADASGSSAQEKVPAKVEVSGSGSRWMVKRLLIPLNADARGEVWIKDNGLVMVADQFSLASDGALHLAGGTLVVSSTFTKPGGTFDFASGTLELRFDVVANSTGPLGSPINLGPGRYLKAKNLTLPGYDTRLNLQGGRLDTGTLTKDQGNLTDTAESTLSVNNLQGFSTLHLLGTMRVGDYNRYSSGNLTVGGGGGNVNSLTVDKSLTVAGGKATLNSPGQLTVGDVLKLQDQYCTLNVNGGSKLTVKSLDASAGKLNLQGGEITINGGVLKPPSGAEYVLDAYSPVSLILTNGGTASFLGKLTIGDTQAEGSPTSTLRQTGGVVNVAGDYLMVGKSKGYGTEGRGTYNLEGTGQLNANGDFEGVGYHGQGTFNLNGGTNRASKYLYIGWGSTGRGTYNVNSGTLTVGDSLCVGGSVGQAGGTGTLNVAGGSASVTNTLKLWSGGTLNLSGGSLSTASLDLSQGTFNWTGGGLTLTGGSNPFCGQAFAVPSGRTLSTSGALNIGYGSSLTAGSGGTVGASGQTIYVGRGGPGTLSVPGGGTVLSGGGSVGYDATGTATVSGTGKWTNSGNLVVGQTGTGTLNVQSGGTVSNVVGYVGHSTGGSGTVTVDGSGSKWTNSSALYVGKTSTGTLNVQNGATGSSNEAFLGFGSAANGTVKVDGNGSQWSCPGRVFVGYTGTGALKADHQGKVSAGNLYLGGTPDAPGKWSTLTVDHAGQVTVNGTLKVWSPGVFSMMDYDAQVTTKSLDAQGAVIDVNKGTFTVNGGSVTGTDMTVQGGEHCQFYVKSAPQGTLSGRLTVGDVTQGNLTQENSSLTLGSTLTLGANSDVRGNYLLQGTSTLNGTTAVLGASGTGKVTQTGGSCYLKNNLYLGNATASSYGSYAMNENDGTATSLSVYSLIDGNHGTGYVEQSRGTADIRGSLYLGYASGGKGTYSYSSTTGPATVAGQAYVGYGGTGLLSHRSGTMTYKGTLRVGNSQGSDGTYKLQSGTLQNDAAYQVIGYQGKGTFEQTGGTNQVNKYLYLAEGSTGSGTYKMTGGTATVGTNLCVGGNNGAAGGPATLTVDNGELRVTSTLIVWGKGTVTINGGKVYADIVDNTHGGTFNLNGGELHVREFRGNLNNNGGTVCPGESPGTMTITGDFTQGPGGTLQIELSDVFDVLTVGGQVSLGGNLQVLLYNGFTLTAGLSFDCLNWGSLVGTFDALGLPALPDGVGWDLSSLYTSGQLNLANLLGPFDVSGTVRDVLLNGLPGVQVTATGTTTASTTTDAQGNYALSLPVGPYTLTPVKFGSTFLPATKAVVVAGNQTGVDFAVTGAPATYSLRGTVRDAGGNRLAGVTMTLTDPTNPTDRTDLTDETGAYSFAGAVAGGYTVTPSLTNYTFAPGSRPVVVGPDQTDVDFTGTAAPYAVSGKVLDGTGAAVAGVLVALSDPTDPTARTDLTDANGAYAFPNLVAGTYTVTPSRLESTFTPASRSVTVGPSQSNVDFVGAVTGYTVSGTLTTGGLPLVGATVALSDPTNPTDRTDTTDAAGAYSFAGVAAGTYDVTPSKAAYGFTPGSLAVIVGPDQTGVDFAGTQQVYSVSGVVTDSDAQPLAGVQVTANGHTLDTGADGAYTLPDLPSGTYDVTVSLAEHAFTPASQSVTVGPDQVGINFVGTENGYTISGVVKDGADQPLAGVTVTLTDPSDPTERTDTTDATGAYSFDSAPAGAYAVTPTLEEHTFAPATQPVTVGPDRTDVNFTGTANTYAVSGTVTDASDQPLEGVVVRVSDPTDPTERTDTTDAAGAYNLTGLVAGTYSVVPAKEQTVFTPTHQTVTVGPDQTGVDFAGAADEDLDGITSVIEAAVSATGDGNGDGIPDAEQGNVVSLPNAEDGSYVTLAVAQGLTLVNTFAYPSPDSGLPQNVDLPVGAVSFALQGVTPGGSATVTMTLHTATPVTTYYKYGPTADNTEPHWYEFLYDGTTGAEINGNVITLHFVDGQRGDWDLTANGTIVDPGGPALPPGAPVTLGSDGNQFSLIAVPAVPGGFAPFTAGLLDHTSSSYLVRWNPNSPMGGAAPYWNYQYLYDPLGTGERVGNLYFGSAELARGAGYWHRAQNAYAGTFESHTDTLEVPAYPGQGDYLYWNLNGNPYTTTLTFSSLSVVSGGTVRSLADAANAGVCGSFGWRYPNPSVGYQLVAVPGAYPGAGNEVPAGAGFWTYFNQNATLRFNPPGAPGLPQTVHKPTPTKAASERHWVVQLKARQAGRRDDCNYFGTASRAQDLPKPPVPPEGDYVGITFVEPGRQGPATRQAAQLRESAAGASNQWEFVVETNSAERVELTWPDLSEVPNELALYLEDLESSRRIYLRTQTAYRFAPAGRAHRFRITADPRSEGALRISSVSVRPDGRGPGTRSVTFSLSQPAAVQVRVLTATGRTLLQAQLGAAQPGLNTVPLTARDARSALARGQYLCELVAATPEGRAARHVTPFTVH